MRVELKFWQQVARRNAKEGAGRKNERVPKEELAAAPELRRSNLKDQHPDRICEREERVHPMPSPPRPTARRHQCSQRHRVKWLVQHYHQEGAKSKQALRLGAHRVVPNAGSDRNPVQQSVKRQTERGAGPRQLQRRSLSQPTVLTLMLVMRMLMVIVMVVVVFVSVMIMRVIRASRLLARHIVMMKVEKALDEEHHQKAGEQNLSGFVDRLQLLESIGQEVEQANAEHQPSNRARRNLQSGVGQLDRERQPASGQRSPKNERTIE